MITNLEVTNFKSIKSIKLKCNRYNIFIGEPNSGKSNILEVLGLLGVLGRPNNLKDFIRFNTMPNLFYDELIDSDIRILVNHFLLKLNYEFDRFVLKYINGNFKINFDHNGNRKGGSSSSSNTVTDLRNLCNQVKLFRFKDLSSFKGGSPESLMPPHGDNLFSVVYSNKKFRKIMKDFIKSFKFDLVFRPQERTFELQKQVEDIIISYPYILASDTVKTILFYLFAIISNQNSTLIFEEPEAHAFPYYTKFIAEKISIERSNQYFIVTHNPYFLASILEKTPKDLINAYITYFEDYQTKVKLLAENQIEQILDNDIDPFFDIKSLYEE